jgi:hypothetical protein
MSQLFLVQKPTNKMDCIFKSQKKGILLFSSQADYCWKACHFTPYVRNPKCLNGSWDEEHVTDTTKKTQKVQTAVKGERNEIPHSA